MVRGVTRTKAWDSKPIDMSEFTKAVHNYIKALNEFERFNKLLKEHGQYESPVIHGTTVDVESVDTAITYNREREKRREFLSKAQTQLDEAKDALLSLFEVAKVPPGTSVRVEQTHDKNKFYNVSFDELGRINVEQMR